MKPYSPAYGLTLGHLFQQFGVLNEDYAPTQDAPNTFPALMQAYRYSCVSGDPLPVFNGECEDTIYGSPEANYAFRYMHDVVHVQLGLEFDVADEIAAAKAQRRMLGHLTPEEERVFFIDTIGQSLWHTITGDFLENQEVFVHWVYEDMRMHQSECAKQGWGGRWQ